MNNVGDKYISSNTETWTQEEIDEAEKWASEMYKWLFSDESASKTFPKKKDK